MKILYVAMKYDYGRPEQGYSFEHYNFFDTLVNLGHEIVYFDYPTLLDGRGKSGMNRLLLEVARAEQPDLMFTVLFMEELDPRVLRTISKRTSAITLNWFTDDQWRFDTFSRRWAPNFDWVVTTATSAVPKYAAIGCTNVIKSQWACNHFLYRKLDLAPRHDVTFVGQLHGDRGAVIERLRREGVDIRVWGRRWESGRLSQEEMIRVFNESRINLNLSNASRPVLNAPPATERLAVSLESRRLGRMVKRPLRPVVRATRRGRSRGSARPDPAPTEPVLADQIKGRNFEVPGCGGFLLTGRVDDLEHYYEPGREVACFGGIDDLVAQVRDYLEHDEERERIAAAGYARTLREHTYAVRFDDIFSRTGLPAGSAAASSSGSVLDVH